MSIEIPPPGTRGTNPRALRIMRVFNGFGIWMYRVSGGRGMRQAGLLTTVGARTGKERTATVGAIPDGTDRWLVVASNSGAAQHPSWYINLTAHPDQVFLELGKDRFKVTPEFLDGDARADAWRRAVAAAPAYGRYTETTDREIPVVRLTREAPSS
jgi:deazaflavin-dependent oxidoreductase (nitroreductase family)